MGPIFRKIMVCLLFLSTTNCQNETIDSTIQISNDALIQSLLPSTIPTSNSTLQAVTSHLTPASSKNEAGFIIQNLASKVFEVTMEPDDAIEHNSSSLPSEVDINTTILIPAVATTTSNGILLSVNRSIIDGPIVIDVYYESLCPDSKRLLTTQVWPLIQKLRNESVKNLISFRFWPYGKSNETFNNQTGRWDFECHHGPNECRGNLWHTCALYGNMSTRGDAEFFIACTYGYANLSEGLLKCAHDGNFSYSELESCTESNKANALMRESGVRTKSLIPKINYVPWVTVNEKYDKETRIRAESALENLTCDLVAAQFKMCNEI